MPGCPDQVGGRLLSELHVLGARLIDRRPEHLDRLGGVCPRQPERSAACQRDRGKPPGIIGQLRRLTEMLNRRGEVDQTLDHPELGGDIRPLVIGRRLGQRTPEKHHRLAARAAA